MSSIVKGIQDTLTELKISQMPDPSEHVASPEFDAEYRDFRTTPDWANNACGLVRNMFLAARCSHEVVAESVLAANQPSLASDAAAQSPAAHNQI
jgi:hypothetical protein